VQAGGNRLTDYLDALGGLPRRVSHDVQLSGFLNQVFRDLGSERVPWNVFHAAHTLGHLLSWLIQQRKSAPEESSPGVHRVAETINYMSENLDQALTVRSIAGLAGLSTAHFSVEFKRVTGSTPRDYLHLLRMHRAVQWLTDTALAVKEIAARLGYQDPFHFSRKFKTFSGMSPRDYRLSHRGRNGSMPQSNV
jgi:AraC-like DNA-binding protein